eukprot:gnl/MRDRNA2_/MRDRNA2_100093_c0_seq1.p1 gnl/MRDRNA2_/MRDRNA2_100093_c0~~gnl/MRDRNA2_/MRDRNA2_100093_c0_seq1.p1  ORF type:complete len:713 (-),score=137.86 gnl/MRDRNA2_/MRDRNA2_100093_c0_seq1:165-2303(-)
MGCGASSGGSAKIVGVTDCSMTCKSSTTTKAAAQVQVIAVKSKSEESVSTESPRSSLSSITKTSSGISPLRLFGPSLAETPAFLLENVLGFLPWHQRGADLLSVSPVFSKSLPRSVNSAYWSCLCTRLSADAGIYLPQGFKGTRLADQRGGWKMLFFELWPQRSAFAASCFKPIIETERRFRLQALLRFRSASGLERNFEVASTSLPLHQRLALLKASNPNLTNSEAMQQVMEEQVDDPQKLSPEVLNVSPGAQGSVLTVSPGCGLRTFNFDHVFASQCHQSDVFDACGLSIAWDFVNGTNGAVIVYGQTGSGKTHTMFGPPPPFEKEQRGLAGNVADFILEAVEQRRVTGFEVSLGVSYVEVFGQETSDLLSDKPVGQNRGANQRIGHRIVLDGQLEHKVHCAQDLESLLTAGDERKRKAATAMNERSTRAHTLLIFRLKQKSKHMSEAKESLLFLADLGGSEKLTKSRANDGLKAAGGIDAGEEEVVGRVNWDEYYKSRERMTETSNINKGLLVLKRCISALRASSGSDTKTRPVRVPFYDSKLTQLLEPALGGPSRTAVLVCASQEPEHAEETVGSLRFGESCRLVERSAQADSVSEAVRAAVAKIDAEVKEVQALIKQKERWETRTTVKKLVVNAMDTGSTKLNPDEVMELGLKGAVEIHADDGKSTLIETENKVTGEFLVGAEEEHLRLEALLDKRRCLLGESNVLR